MKRLIVEERIVHEFVVSEREANRLRRMTSFKLVAWLDQQFPMWSVSGAVEERTHYITEL